MCIVYFSRHFQGLLRHSSVRFILQSLSWCCVRAQLQRSGLVGMEKQIYEATYDKQTVCPTSCIYALCHFEVEMV